MSEKLGLCGVGVIAGCQFVRVEDTERDFWRAYLWWVVVVVVMCVAAFGGRHR